MGTRADFYVGKGKDAEWIGSIAYDGYREGIAKAVLAASTETEFREAVAVFFADRDDVTRPDQGWPWPWDDSSITDCSYWFFDNQVWDEINKKYLSCQVPWPETEEAYQAAGTELIEFPDMSARKRVTFGPRSGVLIIGLPC